MMPRPRAGIGRTPPNVRHGHGNTTRMDLRTGARFPHADFFPPAPAPRGPSVWLARLANDRRELARFWPVVQNMVVQELRVRYQRSILGFVWTLLNPLMMMAILSWVFSSLNHGMKHYSQFLFAGMVPWSFLSICVNDCAFCVIQNEALIKKIYLPKLVFPVARVLISLVTFVLSLAALFVLLWPLGARLSVSMVLLPLAIALLAIFALGIGLVVATANTFYRDCGHLVSVVLQAWYFATPILFPITAFPEAAQWKLRLNPAYYFIEFFHAVLYEGQWPTLGLVATAAVLAAASLGLGYGIFKSQEDKMVFRL
jgi:ABC-2 type transport system permease protein/lipopolysaccharide transport system permease protein